MNMNNTWKKTIRIVTVFLCIQSFGWAATNVPIAIPGTTVSMNPPLGFVLSKNFSGFENHLDSSSITITEMPKEAYVELSPLFLSLDSAAGFSARGISIVSQEDVLIAGELVSVLSGTLLVSAEEVTKYMALFEGEKTVLVTFNIMNKDNTKKTEALSSLKSTVLSETPSIEEKLAQLSFSFQTKEPFRVADILQGSTALLTTFDGTDPSGKLPIAVITRALSTVDANDIESFSEQALRSTQGFNFAKVRVSETKEFAGHLGYFIEATENGQLIKQYITIPKNGRYIRLVALGEKVALENLSGKIKLIADSVLLNE